MRVAPEIRRRSIIPLIGAGLTAIYLFAFAPLSQQADDLDAPLQDAWRKLAAALGKTNAARGDFPAIDFTAITNQLAETRHAIVALETARKEARARAELSEQLRARMNESFQLVEYDSEAGLRMDTLMQLAKQQKVTIDPAVIAGIPEQTADMKEPELLWAELEFIDDLLTSAIRSQVTAIHSVSTPSPLTNAPPANTVRTLAELPIQLELSGPALNVARFLHTLPLRGDELKTAGLPEASPSKPALFVDRLVLRKQSPEKPDEVRLSLRAVGFVFRE